MTIFDLTNKIFILDDKIVLTEFFDGFLLNIVIPGNIDYHILVTFVTSDDSFLTGKNCHSG